ncbi:MAG: hypothetical protein ABWX73_03975 [Marmoricola sp.]
MPRVPLRLALATLVLVVAAGCSDADDESPPAALRVDWKAQVLPTPPGPQGRVAVRDAVRCEDQWFLVGGVFTSGGESRPAVWSSPDAVTWASLPLAPVGYWARRSVLSSVACRAGEVAMVGSKEGGAHGNPRVSTWRQRPDGVFVDVEAAFELYGGPQAVSVGKMAGGPDGWLIAGNRTSGAAVWVSPDATDFTLVDDDPQLSRDDQFDTTALDQVHDGRQWTVVGSATTPGRVPRVPMSWRSDDGRTWERDEVPATEEFNDLEQVVALDDRLVAVGIRGDGFGTWERRGDSWQTGVRFGDLDEDGHAAPFVSSLTTSGGRLVASVSDGAAYALWASGSGEDWRSGRTPTHPTTAGEHTMSVASDGDQVLLLADDGEQGRLWTARWP